MRSTEWSEERVRQKGRIIMYENEIYSDSNTGRYTNYQTDGNFYTGNGSTGPQGNGADGKKKKRGVFGKLMLSLSLGLVFGLFAGAGFYAVQLGAGRLFPQESRNEAPAEIETQQKPASGNVLSNVSQVTYVTDDVSGVVEEVMPAMVSIVNTSTRTGSFFGYTYTESVPSAGSGIIVEERDNELLIVTNNHVVEGADSLEVTFIDGSTAQASIKGLDAEMDLGVIAVAVDSLSQETRNAITMATLGDSDSLKLGMPVIAIGNALGIGQSVTNGIISALDREVTSEDGTTGTFIQTNAAINGGNSGGALLTITGEVIGINSGKIRGTGVEGIHYTLLEDGTRDTSDEVIGQKRKEGYVGAWNQIFLKVDADQIAAKFMRDGAKRASDEAIQRAQDIRADIVKYLDETKMKNEIANLQSATYDSQWTNLTTDVNSMCTQYVMGQITEDQWKQFVQGIVDSADYKAIQAELKESAAK